MKFLSLTGFLTAFHQPCPDRSKDARSCYSKAHRTHLGFGCYTTLVFLAAPEVSLVRLLLRKRCLVHKVPDFPAR